MKIIHFVYKCRKTKNNNWFNNAGLTNSLQVYQLVNILPSLFSCREWLENCYLTYFCKVNNKALILDGENVQAVLCHILLSIHQGRFSSIEVHTRILEHIKKLKL